MQVRHEIMLELKSWKFYHKTKKKLLNDLEILVIVLLIKVSHDLGKRKEELLCVVRNGLSQKLQFTYIFASKVNCRLLPIFWNTLIELP